MKRFKKIVALLLVAMFMLSTSAMSYYNNNVSEWNGGIKYNYVPGPNEHPQLVRDWFDEQVARSYEMKLYENPASFCNRGSYFLAIFRMVNESLKASGRTDLTGGYSYTELNKYQDSGIISQSAIPEVATMSSMGILKGRGTDYQPLLDFDKPITREEAAAVMARFERLGYFRFNPINYNVSFWDIANRWSTNDIMDMAQKGVFNGNGDGSFSPTNFISVQETIAVMEKGEKSSDQITVVNFLEAIRQTFKAITPYTNHYLKPSDIKMSLMVGQTKSVYLESSTNRNINCYISDVTIATETHQSSNAGLKVDITGRKVGKTTLIASIDGIPNSQIRVDVEVTESIIGQSDYPVDIKVSEKLEKLYIGQQFQVNAWVVPTEVKHNKLTYVSTNSSVATVTDRGFVTAWAIGKTTIEVRSELEPSGKQIIKYVPIEVIQYPNLGDGGEIPLPPNGGAELPSNTEDFYAMLDGIKFELLGQGYINVTLQNAPKTVDFYIVSPQNKPVVTVNTSSGTGFADISFCGSGSNFAKEQFEVKDLGNGIYTFSAYIEKAPGDSSYANVCELLVNGNYSIMIQYYPEYVPN